MKNTERKKIIQRMSRNVKPASTPKESTPVSPKSQVLIENSEDYLTLKVRKNFIANNSMHDLIRALTLSVCPLFLNKNKVENNNSGLLGGKIQSSEKLLPHIAFFIEDRAIYTGGRYSIWQQAAILSHYTDVTVVSNKQPLCINDFKDYSENLNIIISENFLNDTTDNEFDLIVGVPMFSASYASAYCNKWKLPLNLVLFETPNFIKEHLSDEQSTEEFWATIKKVAVTANKIITPSKTSSQYIYEWLGNDIDVRVVKPCINEVVAKKVPDSKEYLTFRKDNNVRENVVTYSSRINHFKNPIPIIKNIKKAVLNKITFFLIGKVPTILKTEADKLIKEKNADIRFEGAVDDFRKFLIISNSDLLIHPSKFEGFGMSPMEAQYFDVPVIVYDLDVLRENYKDGIDYVKNGNIKEFAKVIEKHLSSRFRSADPRIKEMASIKRCAADLLKAFDIPRITTGTIVYNGDDYLEYAIKSIKKYVSQIIIVEGAVEGYADKPRSTDNTAKIIKKLISEDIFGKIQLFKKRDLWKDKVEMQNRIADNVKGDLYVKVDHDEVWHPEAFKTAINAFCDKRVMMMKMEFKHFWTNFKTVCKDANGKWSTRHVRIWRWIPGMKHKKSFNYFVTDKGIPVREDNFKTNEFDSNGSDNVLFHFGYARKLKTVKNKIKYYGGRKIEKFVKDTYSKWKPGDKTMPTQNSISGTEEYKGALPEVMNTHPYNGVDDIRKL